MRILLALLLPLPLFAAPVPKGLKKQPPVSFDGYWYLTEATEHGKPAEIGGNWCRRVLIRGEGLGSRMLGWPEGTSEPLTVLDPANPNRRRWNDRPALLLIDGDTLRFYYATDGRAELTEPESGPGVCCNVYQWVVADK